MPDFKVSFDAAGTATWGRLARTSESLSTVSYAGWLGVRLQIEARERIPEVLSDGYG